MKDMNSNQNIADVMYFDSFEVGIIDARRVPTKYFAHSLSNKPCSRGT
jgi:hypothetical protein